MSSSTLIFTWQPAVQHLVDLDGGFFIRGTSAA
jgi:hypothetical protein